MAAANTFTLACRRISSASDSGAVPLAAGRPAAPARSASAASARGIGRGARSTGASTGGSASRSSCVSAGPRRLSTRSASSSMPALCSARRSGAGLGRARASMSRSRNTGPSCDCAASCSRRSASARSRSGSQASTAPTWPLFSACSSAHSRSALGSRWRAPWAPSRPWMTISRCASTPSCASAQAAQRRRRVEEHDAARRGRLGRGDAGQRRRQQPHLADAGVRQQQLGQRLARPAAAGQLGIERGKTAAHGGLARAAQLVGAPQRGMQGFGAASKAAAGSGSPFDDCTFIQLFRQASTGTRAVAR